MVQSVFKVNGTLERRQYVQGKQASSKLYFSRSQSIYYTYSPHSYDTFFLYFRKQSTETTTPSGSPATVTSGELRRAINLANAENIVGGSGSPARSPKPSCSSTGNKQMGPQAAVSTQKLSQVSSVSYI